MSRLKIIENKGTAAVRNLRLNKLRSGRPFMINSKDLFTNQCYLEFPNGSIKLACIIKDTDRDFTILRDLTPEEVNQVRNRFKLFSR